MLFIIKITETFRDSSFKLFVNSIILNKQKYLTILLLKLSLPKIQKTALRIILKTKPSF